MGQQRGPMSTSTGVMMVVCIGPGQQRRFRPCRPPTQQVDNKQSQQALSVQFLSTTCPNSHPLTTVGLTPSTLRDICLLGGDLGNKCQNDSDVRGCLMHGHWL